MTGNPWEAHVDEERLERYAMGVLPKEQAASVEEHLLLCVYCQNKVTELDELIEALRNPRSESNPLPSTDPGRKAAPFGAGWARRSVE